MNNLSLTSEKLSVEKVNEIVAANNCGAISMFIGTTRDNFDGRQVVRLEYEAYESMAYKVMQNICVEMRNKWTTIENIAIHHRLGIVPVGESSVIIAVSSPHRVDAMESTNWCISELKKSVPIWKKEIYADDDPEWKENNECEWKKNLMKLKKNKTLITELVKTKPNIVPSNLIQINCSNSDLNKRIRTFIDRKRELVNEMNVRDFCGTRNEQGCARTSSQIVKRKDAKTHLKVSRVFNVYGPRSEFGNTNVNNTSNYSSDPSNPIEERLQKLENGFGISKPVPKDVYARLKQIEDRLLQLESISPEYAQFWNNTPLFYPTGDTSQVQNSKKKYSIEDIDELLNNLEHQNTT